MPRAERKLTVWFDWPDDPYGARIEVEHLDRQAVAEIAARVYETRNIYNRETGQMEVEQRYNSILDRQLTAERAVRSWEGFVGPDGRQMECTRENKHYWACDRDFMTTLNEFRAIVAEKAMEEEDRKTKN